MLGKLTVLFLGLWSLSLQAKVYQILHTNDLHGFFENTVFNREKGGYAAIRTEIDELKAKAKEKGIETLTLDAGDFMEGNIYYNIEHGKRTLDILNHIGYDAIVMGNHDYLMGVPILDELFKTTPLNFAMLGANLKFNKKVPYVREKIKPYKIFTLGGQKIAVLGITTNEIFYRWRVSSHGKIKNPKKVALKFSKDLKKDLGVHRVIALTHLGVKGDTKIAEDSKYIDLIVGGHSHTNLFEPVMVKNKKDTIVPVVQAGYHGNFLGQILIDFTPGKPAKLLSYKLLPITNIAKNPKVQRYVENSNEKLFDIYGKGHLDEVVGKSEIELIHSAYKNTIWSKIISEALLDNSQADIAFHSNSFAGASLPKGPISRRDLFNTHPRVFDTSQTRGWTLWKVSMRGFLLKFIIKIYLKTGLGFHIAGVDFDIVKKKEETNTDERLFEGEPTNRRYKIDNIKINGEPIKMFKKYRVALSEGIVVGGIGITSLLKLVLRNRQDTGLPFWDALANKVKEIGVITENYGAQTESFPVINHKVIPPLD